MPQISYATLLWYSFEPEKRSYTEFTVPTLPLTSQTGATGGGYFFTQNKWVRADRHRPSGAVVVQGRRQSVYPVVSHFRIDVERSIDVFAGSKAFIAGTPSRLQEMNKNKHHSEKFAEGMQEPNSSSLAHVTNAVVRKYLLLCERYVNWLMSLIS
uniref:Uncharacterized protein n=1 Tax=Romanomermis culicivorax TaxID=13658 RepID=A0A915KXC3_ROMCU